MYIPHMKQGKSQFTPNFQLCFFIIYSIGLLASIALVLAAIMAVVYILNLTMTVIGEGIAHIASLYSSSDSFTKLLLLCILGYILYRVGRAAICKRGVR
ncbi:hypothetical protein [Dictyobacter arantiisoli]|uniref:Uncharacterized protein n=1 Tax=Dictyobacter arantiisoli TaxID=2014874 RepID=A0A5A5TKY6_9CHLR|nr:hypothetical protein [Dictyobacter arantiisoli]GCF11776.1 hypothetical protein KDI_53400 [Dictyobacter arantiisoli]